MPLKICFASAEVTPLAKAGGLADVSGALLKYLHADGHDIRLFMPGYSSIARAGVAIQPVEVLRNLSVTLGSHRYDFSVSTAQLPDSSAVVSLSTVRPHTIAARSTPPMPTSTGASCCS